MVKRAALARELVTEPEIMLFDEPTTGLDPVLGLAMLKLIQRSHQRLSFTGLIVTHEIPRIFQIVDGVAMLRDGKLYFAGTPREFTSSSDPIVQEFIHGSAEAYEASQGQALGL
jgi:phospholipid/cholesterol/gamma-HCH transport system ATP-binding protein